MVFRILIFCIFIADLFCIVNIDIFYILIILENLTNNLTEIVGLPLENNIVHIFFEKSNNFII
jgi:hypothetical protein